jgi:hypothetical protein
MTEKFLSLHIVPHKLLGHPLATIAVCMFSTKMVPTNEIWVNKNYSMFIYRLTVVIIIDLSHEIKVPLRPKEARDPYS